jgi:surface antigen
MAERFNLPHRTRSRYVVIRAVAVSAITTVALAINPSTPAVVAKDARHRRPLVVQLPPKLAAASGGYSIVVSARTQASATCRASVSVKRTHQRLAAAKATRSGRVSWRWQILATSPSGNWKIAVTCTKAGRSATASRTVLVVTRSAKSRGTIGDPNSLQVTAGAAIGRGGGGAGLSCGPFTNVYPNAQCTCGAYSKRPDVYNTAVARGVPAGGSRAAGSDYYVWDGGQWLVNAQRAGIPTGAQPVAGALVVWGVPNTRDWGHVAYVEQVASSTNIKIFECNYDWNGSCREIWMNPQAKAHLQGYIYGGSAGGGAAGGASGGGASPGGSGPVAPAPTPTRALTLIQSADGTGTGQVEVHYDSAASGYQQRGGDWASTFATDGGDAGDHWQMADMDGDGRPDLVLIRSANGTGTGHVEVHFDSAASGFRQRVGNWGSTFATDGGDPGDHWQMADMDGDGRPDLVLIRSAGTGTGHVEVHFDSAASGFRQRVGDWASTFATDGGDPGDHWQMADMDGDGRPDLVLIRSANGTGTGHVEVHFDSAASGFRQRVGDWGSTFATDGGDAGDHWQMADMDGDSRPDLVLIRSGDGTGTGHVEVHFDSAASGFQQRVGDWGSTFATDGGALGDHWSLAAFP